ncbi:hypothetical protein ACOMHN_050726 [Nucella lapillus]
MLVAYPVPQHIHFAVVQSHNSRYNGSGLTPVDLFEAECVDSETAGHAQHLVSCQIGWGQIDGAYSGMYDVTVSNAFWAFHIVLDVRPVTLRLISHSTSRLQDNVYKHIIELGILHNGPPSTKRGCRAGRLHRLWHGLPPAPWPCTRSQHHSVPSRNLHPLMVPPFLQPHPDLQSAVGNAPLSSKHPAQLPTTDCLLSIISPMGGKPSDAPALSPPSPLQQGGQSSNAPALSPPSPLPQGGQPIALALSPPSPPPQGDQPSDAPGLSPSSSTLLLCPSDSTLSICHFNSQSAVKTVITAAYVGGVYDCNPPWSNGVTVKITFRIDRSQYPSKCGPNTTAGKPVFQSSPDGEVIYLANCTVTTDIRTSCTFISGTIGCGCTNSNDNGFYVIEYNFFYGPDYHRYWEAEIACLDGNFAPTIDFTNTDSNCKPLGAISQWRHT